MSALRIYCIVAMLTLLFAATQSLSQEDMVVVDNSIFEKPVRAPALFEHDVHNEVAGIEDCAECHHLYEDGKRVEDESSEDQACSECHSEKGDGNSPSLRRAYHLNCKGCHLDKAAGPIMCMQCHRSDPGTDGAKQGQSE
ncbi:MAG: cytochrome c3 family protein [Desulfobacteraceae bacterium]|jgi:hypothetical protein